MNTLINPAKRLAWFVICIASCLLVSCARQLFFDVASEKKYEEMMLNYPDLMTNSPPSEWPFPNYQTGPLRPLPKHLNFYGIDDRYPDYLLCEYKVAEKQYAPANEPMFFKAALEQIRDSGSCKFPPIKLVAVIIRNVAEHKGASTAEQSFKAGAIFYATNLFDSSCDLSQLIARTVTDRHPFKYDLRQRTPSTQQRWVIVERHAATNNPITKQ